MISQTGIYFGNTPLLMKRSYNIALRLFVCNLGAVRGVM